jgi:acyl-CoA thioesterase-2
MQSQLKPLLERLDLERIDRDLFRGLSPDDGRPRVFGGQVAAQALVAAVRTVEERRVHSLHAYFLRPGDPKIPILYEVDRIRDGRSFSTRRVVAIQEGEAIFSMAASFQKDESGPDHQVPMPEVAPPESVPSTDELIHAAAEESGHPIFRFLERLERPIEVHDLDPSDPRRPEKKTEDHIVWFRARGELPDDALLHQCVLTYATDLTLLDASLRAARAHVVRSHPPGRERRSRHLVPPPVPRGSMAPLRHHEREHVGRAWPEFRAHLHAGRRPRGHRRAGEPDARAPAADALRRLPRAPRSVP